MNELLNLGLTMTSLEIADLVGARHDNVKRTIERLAERGIIAFPPLEEKVETGGRPTSWYVFIAPEGKRDSIVVVAQLSPEFTARLVDRWQELEGMQKPKTRLELAKEQVRLIEALERKEREVETLKITLDESKQWASVKRMEAKHLRRFDWRLLKAHSMENDIDIQTVFDANYGKVNSYRADVWQAVYNITL